METVKKFWYQIVLTMVIILAIGMKNTIAQDTTTLIKLQPIEALQISFLTTAEQQQIDEENRTDSIYNCERCVARRMVYDSIGGVNSKIINKYVEEVKRLNSQHINSSYYYYLSIECNNEYELGDCRESHVIICRRAYTCMDLEIEIKQELITRIYSGYNISPDAVYFYGDLRKIP